MTRRLIHIVDDEESIRRSTDLMLRTAGFKVKIYGSGVEFVR